MTSDDTPQARRATPEFTRTIVDDQGRVWLVRELNGASYDRRAQPSLVFSTDEVMRRVRAYPSNWAMLPDAELYAVSLHR